MNSPLLTRHSPPATPPLSPLPPLPPLPPLSPLPSIHSPLFAIFPARRPTSNPFTFWRLRTLSRHNGGAPISPRNHMNPKTTNSCPTNAGISCVPSPTRTSLLKQQLPGALRGLDHRLDQRDAQLALFQLEDAVNRATSRRRHGVFEQGWVVACLQGHARRSLHSLRGQQRRDVARQPHLD